MANYFLVQYPEKPIQIEKNDIVLPERRVSRWHAKIEWQSHPKPGQFVICDLGSSNGTYLNNRKITIHPKPIKDRDKIRIASAVFTVRMVDDPSEIENEFSEFRERAQLQVTEVINIAELKAMREQLGFAGDLANLCPVELFQMFETGSKTGDLMIKIDDIRGNFIIKEGLVIKAEFGEKLNEEAVYEVLQFTKGMFAFKPRVVNEEPQISLETKFLLMEGCRMLDERAANDS
jgi:pSer/pThr/pTyr-binding forkhead associated (FHA) protein